MYKRFNPKQNRQFRNYRHKELPKHELLNAIRAIEISKGSKKQEAVHYSPKLSFSDFNLSDKLIANISAKKYMIPTTIQQEAIEPILAGRDLIGIANTGTGKTAAFLIPLVEKAYNNTSERILIIAPTRELALQIQQELKGFAWGLGIRSVLCIGGMSIKKQKNELRQNINFLIGTPGRIRDLINEQSLNLERFNTVVLDEADRMVDVGFIADIKYFISLLSSKRQSLFFSATISPKVKEILNAFVLDPVTVAVEKQATAENIDHKVIEIPKNEKIDKLHDLLSEDGYDKVLVFGRTKWGMQKLTEELVRRGIRAEAIHGNKSQGQRQKALERFKSNQVSVLVATDVASRGLDIPDVSHVINFDMPSTYEDYIHRVGRTGRMDKKGTAVTLIEQK